VFQPLTILSKLCESDRKKRSAKPEPEDDTDNNAGEKKHCGQDQSAPAPSPVQNQRHQVEQKNDQQEEATGKANQYADKQQTHCQQMKPCLSGLQTQKLQANFQIPQERSNPGLN
jgi:hypothetical protein